MLFAFCVHLFHILCYWIGLMLVLHRMQHNKQPMLLKVLAQLNALKYAWLVLLQTYCIIYCRFLDHMLTPNIVWMTSLKRCKFSSIKRDLKFMNLEEKKVLYHTIRDATSRYFFTQATTLVAVNACLSMSTRSFHSNNLM